MKMEMPCKGLAQINLTCLVNETDFQLWDQFLSESKAGANSLAVARLHVSHTIITKLMSHTN